jgi:hypothetical protein
MGSQFNRFFICLLDVLGFESRFNELGLPGMLEKYVQLIQIVNSRNEWTEKWFGPFNFSEGAYWTAEGDAFISARLYGAYASDSIILFAHADFPQNRYPEILRLSPEERDRRANDPAQGWMHHTVPCDNFLDLCNEVICHSIEIGLPLRGGISMGEAVLHLDHGIYLGKPLIDAARLEKPQQCIGASFTSSFLEQLVPERYKLDHIAHFKKEPPSHFGGAILDWPRHWRNTRKVLLLDAIDALDTDVGFSEYYSKTKSIIGDSGAAEHLYSEPEHTFITKVYPQYSSPLLELNTRPYRAELRVTSDETDNT